MKRIIFSMIIISALLTTSARAQTVNEAVAIGCGGGFSTSGQYAGNCTIGLPFVGLLQGSNSDTTRLGMYDALGPTRISCDSSSLSFDTLYGEFAKMISNPAFGYRECEIAASDSGNGVAVQCSIIGTDYSFDDGSVDTVFFIAPGHSQILELAFKTSTTGPYDGTLILSTRFDTIKIPLQAYAIVDYAGVKESHEVTFSLYPNPTTGAFTIDATNLGDHISATLYDERGAFVLDAMPFMTRENDNLQFTLHTLASGSYILTLDDGKKRYSYKLSIQY